MTLFSDLVRAAHLRQYSHQVFDPSGAANAGVLGFDAFGGFWLLHSAPRFPSAPSQGEYTGGLFSAEAPENMQDLKDRQRE